MKFYRHRQTGALVTLTAFKPCYGPDGRRTARYTVQGANGTVATYDSVVFHRLYERVEDEPKVEVGR